MWEVIKDLVDEGTTVLLTTQYLEEADQLANRIVVVDRGKIIAEGAAHELKSQLGGERLTIGVGQAGDLVRAGRVLLAMVDESLRDSELQVDTHARQVTVPFPAGSTRLAEAIRNLDDAGLEITDVTLRRPTLDDVFLQLTGHTAEEKPINGDDENPSKTEEAA